MRLRTLIVLAIAATSLPVLSVCPVKADPGAANPQGKEVAPSPGKAGKGFYGTLGLGGAWPQNASTDALFSSGSAVTGTYGLTGGFSGEAGVGYDFGPVRTELTYTYSGSSLDALNGNYRGNRVVLISTSNLSTNSVLLNAYVDIPTQSKFTPYIGGGLGYTNMSWANYSAIAPGAILLYPSGNQNGLGYQAKAGVAYQVSPKADIFVEGTYQGSTFFGSNLNVNSLNAFGARLGARYRFGGSI